MACTTTLVICRSYLVIGVCCVDRQVGSAALTSSMATCRDCAGTLATGQRVPVVSDKEEKRAPCMLSSAACCASATIRVDSGTYSTVDTMAALQSLHLPQAPVARVGRSRRRQPALLRPCQATATEYAVAKLVTNAAVTAEIEKTSWTSRKLYAAVGINAPVPVVWGCLTDYDGLGTFIPSLVQNKCLEKKRNGAVLKQVGAQEVAMGVSFSAACTLDCTEYPTGIPRQLCSSSGDGKDGLLPYPRTSLRGLRCQDIAFEQLDGDFQAFRGIWRLQPVTGPCGTAEIATLLSYSLYVKPKPWLPVGLIQDRIEKEVTRNLQAVRQYAEKLQQLHLMTLSEDMSE